ncbi:MAG TPA: 16S rRNA (adenine(1518)-N(6)/adenine(1519)-N(6))-dimethyltransferase RsmA [Candidatus Saccharimonadales bacterium]|nr:16S rRNA (adenine(1518)-N(6)/adenine(1519)-N(6))-dimethyltransferase RsmA [Candidatus Saccharimonadales bacterium]
MNLSEMKQTLAGRRIQLSKSLGQNFLHDYNVLHKIAAAGELTKSDLVLEIGPGLGPLTKLLLDHAGEVLAIEKDQRLLEVLRERFTGVGHLKLLHDDALDYLRVHQDWSRWKVVSNLPYSVASPILVELAQMPQGPERIVATLQFEVVQRLMARAGHGDYGLLTLLVQARYEPVAYFKIASGSFFPPPDVDSACITLIRRREPVIPLELQRPFEKIIRRGFSQRRKIFLKLLKADWPEEKLRTTFEVMQLDQKIRAEKLTLEQFAQMARLLTAT